MENGYKSKTNNMTETSEILKEILAELKEHSTILNGNTTELQSISQCVKTIKEDISEIQTTIDRYTRLEKRVGVLEKKAG